jgi:hypothetical protein
LRCDGTVVSDKIKKEDVVSKTIELNTTSRKLELDFLYNGGEFGLVK